MNTGYSDNLTRNCKYRQKEHPDYPLYGFKKWRMWLVKFMEISGIKGYDILLRGNMKTSADNVEKAKGRGVTCKSPRSHNCET